jgi:hypothetical protein
MKDVVHIDKLSKISIYGYQDPSFLCRQDQDRVRAIQARHAPYLAAIQLVFDPRIDQQGISSDFGLLPGQDLDTIK